MRCRLLNSSWFFPSLLLCLIYSLIWLISPLRQVVSKNNIFTKKSGSRLIFNKVSLGEKGLNHRIHLYGSTFEDIDTSKRVISAAVSYWHDPVLFLQEIDKDLLVSQTELVSQAKLSRISYTVGQHKQLIKSDLLRGVQDETIGSKNNVINDKFVTFICEIPRGTTAKLEIKKEEINNPIAIDIEFEIADESSRHEKIKKGRHYKWASLVNYGSLPRTYSHPTFLDIYTHRLGDGDPIDALEICPSMEPCESGELYKVKILGALPMRDGNTTDWKVIVLREDCFSIPTDKLTDISELGLDMISLSPVESERDVFLQEEVEEVKVEEELLLTDDAITGPIFEKEVDDGLLRNSFLYFIRRGIDDGEGKFINEAKRYFVPLLKTIKEWFKQYKRDIVKKVNGNKEILSLSGEANKFDFNGKWIDATIASKVVQMHHKNWCLLLHPVLQGEKKFEEIGINLDTEENHKERVRDWIEDCNESIINS
jgi:inorganic pyrophosphatase